MSLPSHFDSYQVLHQYFLLLFTHNEGVKSSSSRRRSESLDLCIFYEWKWKLLKKGVVCRMSGQTLNILFKSLFSLVYKSPETKNCLVFVTLEWVFYIYRWVRWGMFSWLQSAPSLLQSMPLNPTCWTFNKSREWKVLNLHFSWSKTMNHDPFPCLFPTMNVSENTFSRTVLFLCVFSGHVAPFSTFCSTHSPAVCEGRRSKC